MHPMSNCLGEVQAILPGAGNEAPTTAGEEETNSQDT